MDNIHSLDPRKQELLEARFLGNRSFSNSVQEQLLQAQQQVNQNASIMQNTSGLNLAIGANNSNSNNNQDSNLSAASGSSVSSDKEIEAAIKRFLRNRTSHAECMFDHYFAEYIWQRSRDHLLSDETFNAFLKSVMLYPPIGEDQQ
ncbi:hypothetical protein TNCV_4584911 [Trichonephila clavipes]|nr:hypothetical protein TNCV_4584911 [Trichonephila clavipes]